MELPDAAAAETVKNDRREIFDMAVYSLVVIRVYFSDGSQLNVIIQLHRRILYQILALYQLRLSSDLTPQGNPPAAETAIMLLPQKR